jgi:hypothetical protein
VNGVQPTVAGAVKAATGPSMTTGLGCTRLSTQPMESVTTSFTGYVPGTL